MPPKSYSSTPAPDAEPEVDSYSTEGMTFTLDDQEFTCHGQLDGNDLVELAVPMMDASEGWFDPEALAAVGRFYKLMLGPDTYRAFTRHRREHRTPQSVVAEIMMDLIAELTAGPPAGPSPSPAGPPITAPSSPAASRSPAIPARQMRSPAGPAIDPAGIIPPEMAEAAEVVLAPAPSARRRKTAREEPQLVRTVNLGNPDRTTATPASRT
jgi:hypothetical protein